MFIYFVFKVNFWSYFMFTNNSLSYLVFIMAVQKTCCHFQWPNVVFDSFPAAKCYLWVIPRLFKSLSEPFERFMYTFSSFSTASWCWPASSRWLTMRTDWFFENTPGPDKWYINHIQFHLSEPSSGPDIGFTKKPISGPLLGPDKWNCMVHLTPDIGDQEVGFTLPIIWACIFSDI